jgi:hypothetical protein
MSTGGKVGQFRMPDRWVPVTDGRQKFPITHPGCDTKYLPVFGRKPADFPETDSRG